MSQSSRECCDVHRPTWTATQWLRTLGKDGTVDRGAQRAGMSSESSNVKDRVSIGRIPLKQVRVNRNERKEEAPKPNPMNKLVPYLDLFCRLGDDELARLANVDKDVCASLRTQVDAINAGLAAYVDLLPRLSDAELTRLTGASDRTIRFWRLCQPRADVAAKAPAPAKSDASASAEKPGVPSEKRPVPTAPHSVVTESLSSDSGKFPAAEGATDKDAAGYVTLSGAPFPGFDTEGEAPAEPAIEGVSLEEVEGEPDPLGLNNP